jgi:hypothetical protein
MIQARLHHPGTSQNQQVQLQSPNITLRQGASGEQMLQFYGKAERVTDRLPKEGKAKGTRIRLQME